MSGSVTKAKEDLAGNLGKGVEQLLDFRDDILAGRTENEAFSNAKEIQLLAVTHDNVPWANFIFPQLIEDGDQVQFASVEELELLQTYCWNQSPFRVLRDKISGTHTAQQDVGSYVRAFHGPGLPRHPMLSAICDNFMRDMGATVPPR